MNQPLLINYRHQLEQADMPAGKKKTLLAAIELFAQHGFNGTSTAQLAETAQVSQATIFKYFKTKQDILQAIIQPLLDTLKNDFWQELYQYTNLEEMVHFVVVNRLSFLSDNQDLAKILIQEYMVNPSLQALIRSNLANWQPEFMAYVDTLKQVNPDLNPDLTTLELLSIFAGNMLTYLVQASLFQTGVKPDLTKVEKRILLLLRERNI